MIHRVNSLTQLQIKEYNKELLKPVTTKVKYHMPTVEGINLILLWSMDYNIL